MRYHCCEERRLAAAKAAGVLNGIEFVEVSDSEAPTPQLRQRTIFVRLLQPEPGLTAANVVIAGGDRIPTVGVEWVAPATNLPAGEDPALVAGITDPATVLVVRTDGRGDFSWYTFSLVAPGTDTAPAGFDVLLNRVELSFKVECDADFDCRPGHRCPRHADPPPPIDYLAKDYGSFRRLLLDRLSVLAPAWTERTPADVGVTLVEMLAYVGDQLSYRQDAVATEAYLETSRRRTSLRRHARLVDYHVHEGSNARVWATITPGGAGVEVPAGTALLTGVPGIDVRVEPGDRQHRDALAAGAETFETIEPSVLYDDHDAFDFWTWGDLACCLPVGATAATLVGLHPELRAGDVLILAEVLGPQTGQPEDADPEHRAAVRLVHVADGTDPLGGRFANPPTNAAVDVTLLEWDPADALRFPLCISVEGLPGAVARAHGNVVLADHGRTIEAEAFEDPVPAPVLRSVAELVDHCGAVANSPVPVRFRPTLEQRPLTHAGPAVASLAEVEPTPALLAELAALTVGPLLEGWLRSTGTMFTSGPPVLRGGDGSWSVSDGATVVRLRLDAGTLALLGRPPAAAASGPGDPARAGPAVQLDGTTPSGTSDTWLPQRDLLAGSADSRIFVVETEHDGTATLRFGDGVHGRRPETGTTFTATYRVGNGSAGNIGAASLGHVVSTSSALVAVTNLLPATGGVDPESAGAVVRNAPEAFLVQERAVTPGDYERIADRHTEVQRAAATFRWTGSWHTVFVTADRIGGRPVDAAFEEGVRDHLEPFRMAGYDLEVDAPTFVALDVALDVCADPEHFRSDVRLAVLDRLTSRTRADGTTGLFHADRLTFGQAVHLSGIVAEVQGVPGVQSVRTVRFRRLRDRTTGGLATGVLPMGRLEIARLDGDPNFPERGVLDVAVGGGK